MMMKKVVIIILMSVFTVSFCMAQQNIQAQQQIERRYQEAIVSAQKSFSQRQYSEAKQYYITARDLKPENAGLINEIIAEIDKLLAVETNPGRQIEIDTGLDRSPVTNYQGTMVPGATLTAKLDWLDRSAESHNTYIVEVNADESIAPRTLGYRGGIDITVVLRGDNQNRTIRLSSHGTMFKVSTDVTFILDGNITLRGHNGNNGSMVHLDGGTLKMNAGTTITGNTEPNRNSGGGVYVGNGTFEMTGGTISGNTSGSGGGVYVGRGTFIMTSGTISGNTANEGGGVYNEGRIIVGIGGGGSGTFKMTGGTISGNTANKGGGVSGRNFTMYGGTITGNTAHEYGGGVYSDGFTKTGGTITGYNSDRSNGNVVRDNSGVLARKGHAVYYDHRSSPRRKETTAGPGTNLSSDSANNWDQ